MKTKNKKRGIILYTSCLLNKMNQNSRITPQKNPKEVFVLWTEIMYVTTTKIDNWIRVKTTNGKVYFEESSLVNFTRLAENSSFIFSKITGGMAVNVAKIIAKTDYSNIILENGEIHKINKYLKNRFKYNLLRVWDE